MISLTYTELRVIARHSVSEVMSPPNYKYDALLVCKRREPTGWT